MDTYPIVKMKENDATYYESFMGAFNIYLIDLLNQIQKHPYGFTIAISFLIITCSLLIYKKTEKKTKKAFRLNSEIHKIMDQIGSDKESWPVLLVNQMILLQKDIHKLQ